MSTNITGNVYVDNFLINGVALFPFLLGLWLENDGLIGFGIAIYWITAVGGSLTMFLPEIVWEKSVRAAYEKEDTSLIEKARNKGYVKFNIFYDIAITLMLAVTGYGILAAVYLLHVFGYLKVFENLINADNKHLEHLGRMADLDRKIQEAEAAAQELKEAEEATP